MESVEAEVPRSIGEPMQGKLTVEFDGKEVDMLLRIIGVTLLSSVEGDRERGEKIKERLRRGKEVQEAAESGFGGKNV